MTKNDTSVLKKVTHRTEFPTERTSFTQNFQFPSENEVVYENPLTFMWIPVEDAKSYILTVYDGEKVVEEIETTHCYANLKKQLEAKQYFWTVKSNTGLLRDKMSFSVSSDAVHFERPSADEVFDAYPAERPSYIFRKSEIPKLLEERQDELEALKRNVLIAYDMPFPKTATHHWYPYSLDVKVYFSEHRLHCDRDMIACALLYALTGDEKAGEHGRKLMLSICDMNPLGPCAIDGEWADETGISNIRNLPCAFDMLYPLLSDKQRRYVADTIAVYAQQCENKLKQIDFETNPSNSHAGRVPAYLGGAALVLKGTGAVPEDTLKRWLSYALDICCGIFPYYGGNDGSWAEGVFYSSSYTKWFLPFYAAVERFTGKSLLNRPFYHRLTNFLIHFCDHRYENHPFGDCYYETPLSDNWPGFFAQNPFTVYADKFGPKLAMDRKKEYSKQDIYYLHLLDLFIPTLKKEEKSLAKDPEDVAVFPDSGFIAMHSDLYSSNDICVMARCSRFTHDSHRHKDQGSFALFAGGTSLISPSGYYGIGYGTKHHYEWKNSTKAHNAILVDGEGQESAYIMDAVGKIVSVDKESKCFVMDMSGCYDKLNKWQRTISLNDTGITVIDEIGAKEPVEITYCLHALSQPESIDNSAVIERNDKKLTITPKDGCMELECISDKFDIDVNEGQPEHLHVKTEPQYHIYYKTKKKDTHILKVEFTIQQ